jgi:hypothetical protein
MIRQAHRPTPPSLLRLIARAAVEGAVFAGCLVGAVFAVLLLIPNCPS